MAGVAMAGVTMTASPAAAAGTAVQSSWHANQARVPEARPAGRGGKGVVVAVLDSWVDGVHRDFEGRVLAGADCVGGPCRSGPAAQDPCHHGTHVAGTVASSSYGVAPQATVLPVRVLSYDEEADACVGRPDDVAAGIRWSVANGARVVNLSLGPDVPLLAGGTALPEAVSEAARAGVLVIFSAGNTGLEAGQRYGDEALVVAATGPDGQLASYSQPGDLAAPGGDPIDPDVCSRADCVTSLFPGNGYSVAAGTSMAAPHVSGVAALLIGQDGSRSREQLLERLRGSVRGEARLIDARAALGVSAAQTTSRSESGPEPVPSSGADPGTQARSAFPTRAAPAPTAPATGSGAPQPPDAAASAPAGAPPAATPGAEAPIATAPAPQSAPAPPPTALVGSPVAGDPRLPSGPVALAVGLVVVAAAGTVAGARRP
jgi:subtilisin family serine protease